MHKHEIYQVIKLTFNNAYIRRVDRADDSLLVALDNEVNDSYLLTTKSLHLELDY